MTAINRLTNKPEPISSDLIPIWDSQAGRTRNTSTQAVSDFTGNSINPVVGISFVSPNLVVTYFDGTQTNIDLTP